MTPGVVAGNLIGLMIGGVMIGCSTSASFSGNTNLTAVACKDDEGWEDGAAGNSGWSISVDGVWKFDATYGGKDLLAAWVNKTVVTLLWSTEVNGDTFISGDGVITSFSWDAPGDDNSTYSVEFTGKGAPVIGLVA